MRQVFCGNLAFDMDEQCLRDVMSKCGEVRGVRLATDRDSGRFKGKD
jgi:RNA recognition motif-containing protein